MRHISGSAVNVGDFSDKESATSVSQSTGDPTGPLARIASVSDGSVVIAGDGFGSGYGSSAALLREHGVRCVVARSFARRFYREAINSGLALFTADLVGKVKDGDQVTFDLRKGTVAVGEQQIQAERYPERLARVVEYGGLVAAIKKELGKD